MPSVSPFPPTVRYVYHSRVWYCIDWGGGFWTIEPTDGNARDIANSRTWRDAIDKYERGN